MYQETKVTHAKPARVTERRPCEAKARGPPTTRKARRPERDQLLRLGDSGVPRPCLQGLVEAEATMWPLSLHRTRKQRATVADSKLSQPAQVVSVRPLPRRMCIARCFREMSSSELFGDRVPSQPSSPTRTNALAWPVCPQAFLSWTRLRSHLSFASSLLPFGIPPAALSQIPLRVGLVCLDGSEGLPESQLRWAGWPAGFACPSLRCILLPLPLHPAPRSALAHATHKRTLS